MRCGRRAAAVSDEVATLAYNCAVCAVAERSIAGAIMDSPVLPLDGTLFFCSRRQRKLALVDRIVWHTSFPDPVWLRVEMVWLKWHTECLQRL